MARTCQLIKLHHNINQSAHAKMSNPAASDKPPSLRESPEQDNAVSTSKPKFNFLAMAMAQKIRNDAMDRMPRSQIPDPESYFTPFPKSPVELCLRVWKFALSPGHGMITVNIIKNEALR
ncbi:hypothetical protein BDZ45DRAFT_754869 [Acephala macrosclerotiorum]|nr:hypothetical protein BDZ45DRAFT_754869 [Acephala macrosclerotiorum]